jgi:cell division protein FtsB
MAQMFVVHGTDILRDLVPKVIRILEFLEMQAMKNERETNQLFEMQKQIGRLESEKNETRELRDKFDRELELIEEQWRREVGDVVRSTIYEAQCCSRPIV